MPAPESPSDTSRSPYDTRNRSTRATTPELSESNDFGDSSPNRSESLSGSPLSPEPLRTKVRTNSSDASPSISSSSTSTENKRKQTDKDGATRKIESRPGLRSKRSNKSPSPDADSSFILESSSSSSLNDDNENWYAEGNRSSNAKTQHSDTNVNSNQGYNFILFLTIGVAALAIILYIFWLTSSSNQNHIPSGDKFRDFVSRIESVESKFSNQNSRLWRVVKASALHVLNETEPRYPVVLLLATPGAQALSSRCIAKRVSSEFEGVYGLNSDSLVVSNIDEWKNLDPATQKKQLDDQLQATFGGSRRKAVVIDNLQSLHPDAALMLHGYCDNDNAPFKDVMIVLLLNIDTGKVSRFTSQQVEDYLEQLWSQTLGTDKVKALLSRVANNIIIVDGEDQTKISSIC